MEQIGIQYLAHSGWTDYADEHLALIGETAHLSEMLAMSEGRIHSVAEFAARLFVTPKYLSMSVKQTTGKPALVWIHEAEGGVNQFLFHIFILFILSLFNKKLVPSE